MAEVTDEALFMAIGHAVVSAQLFEKIFVITARFAIKQANLQVFQEIETVEAAKAFRQPISGLLKEVSGKMPTDELEDRIDRLIGERNRVVHKLVDECPWPGPATEDERHRLLALCLRVSEESSALAVVLNSMQIQWMARFPEINID